MCETLPKGLALGGGSNRPAGRVVTNCEESMTQNIEEPEGLDAPASGTWGSYPLDSVFVRTEQRTLAEVVKRIEQGRYKLDPEFQRDFVWKPDRQSRLIESCLMRIPLPVFYVAEEKSGRIVVVDGLQRLTTFTMYLDNKFALTGLDSDGDAKHPLQGLRFLDLPLHLQERIEDTQLTLYMLDAKAPERAKLDIFDRVNSGVPLSRQQMRNSLYSGAATAWLRDAASGKPFQKATGGSLDPLSMRDREAINRFCAFHLMGHETYKSGDMDAFLAEALGKMNTMTKEELIGVRESFDRSMNLNFRLFGEHSFRKSLKGSAASARSVINIALFDVFSTYFAQVEEAALSEERAVILREKVVQLLSNPIFNHAITYSTNSTRQVQSRFWMVNETME